MSMALPHRNTQGIYFEVCVCVCVCVCVGVCMCFCFFIIIFLMNHTHVCVCYTSGRKLLGVDDFGSIFLSGGDLHTPPDHGERPPEERRFS